MRTIAARRARVAARAVRQAEHGREAIGVARSRSTLGMLHARAPLSIMLRVAAEEGRLVWQGQDSFALLERPLTVPVPAGARGGPGLRLLRLIDRRWDMLVFAGPPAVTLTIASVAGVITDDPPLGLVALPLAAVAYVAFLMFAHVVAGWAILRRLLGRRPSRWDEIAAESYPAWNWSLRLCHHTAATPAERLLRATTAQLSDLVRLDAEPAPAREMLVVLVHGATTDALRAVIRASLVQPFGADSRIALRLPPASVRDYRNPAPEGGGFLALWLAGVAAVLAVTAYLIAFWESPACGGASCADRPATWATAAQWLAWRLLFQNPPGVVPGTAWAMALGWLFSLLGLMTLPIAAVSVRLAVTRHRQATEAFRIPLVNRRLLLLTVTPTERDAVLAALRDLTGHLPERSFSGRAVIYDAGAIGRTTVAMAQCARPGSGGPGGAQAIASEVIERWGPDFVIMVGICCGLRDDDRSPQNLGDVVVATSIYDLDQGIQHADRVEPTGDRVSVHPAMAARLSAASTDFTVSRVHFGQLLSAQTLLDSDTRREEIKTRNTRAIAYEMEAHGLYAAAAGARVPWAVVKAISDWGVDREFFYVPEPAARHAAAFVVHAIEVGAFDQAIDSV